MLKASSVTSSCNSPGQISLQIHLTSSPMTSPEVWLEFFILSSFLNPWSSNDAQLIREQLSAGGNETLNRLDFESVKREWERGEVLQSCELIWALWQPSWHMSSSRWSQRRVKCVWVFQKSVQRHFTFNTQPWRSLHAYPHGWVCENYSGFGSWPGPLLSPALHTEKGRWAVMANYTIIAVECCVKPQRQISFSAAAAVNE